MNRYYCTECDRTYTHAGDCPRCEDEPLLDLNNPTVRTMLDEQDAREVRERRYKYILIAVAPGVLGGIALLFMAGSIGIELPPALLAFPLVLCTMIAEVFARYMVPGRRGLTE